MSATRPSPAFIERAITDVSSAERFACAARTSASTPPACSPPMMPIRAFGLRDEVVV